MLTKQQLLARYGALKSELARAGPHQRRLLREALQTVAQALRAERVRDDRRGG